MANLQGTNQPVAWPVLNTEEREALERFNETCEDGQEYDVSKSMMKHLAELGVVYSAGFGRYGFTEFGRAALNTTPPQRKPLWIDPNDKTQEKFLPSIGETVLFCYEGKTYYGRHTGGSFQYGAGVTKRDFNTWECRWMDLPAAHGIKGDA